MKCLQKLHGNFTINILHIFNHLYLVIFKTCKKDIQARAREKKEYKMERNCLRAGVTRIGKHPDGKDEHEETEYQVHHTTVFDLFQIPVSFEAIVTLKLQPRMH